MIKISITTVNCVFLRDSKKSTNCHRFKVKFFKVVTTQTDVCGTYR